MTVTDSHTVHGLGQYTRQNRELYY